MAPAFIAFSLDATCVREIEAQYTDANRRNTDAKTGREIQT
ncbi:hypothetical protein CURE108131_13715 [Cupriavidus respiraculi]